MIKLMEFLKRKPGLTYEEFSRYWVEKHGPLVARHVPGVVRYVQNHAVRLGRGEPPIDGVAELWFADREAWKQSAQWVRSEASKVLHDSEEKFIDRSKLVVFVTEEKVLKDGNLLSQ